MLLPCCFDAACVALLCRPDTSFATLLLSCADTSCALLLQGVGARGVLQGMFMPNCDALVAGALSESQHQAGAGTSAQLGRQQG